MRNLNTLSVVLVTSMITMTAVAGTVRDDSKTTPSQEEQKEMSVARGASFSAAKAVTMAEHHTAGHAIEIGIAEERGQTVWEVKTQLGMGLIDTFLDTDSGAIIGSDAEGGAKSLPAIDRIALADALQKAESETHGRTLEAVRESKNGVIVYAIELVTASGVVEVNVDAASGELMMDHEGDA